MSRPYKIEEDDLALKSNFKKRVVLTDLNKNYFEQLSEHKNDFLLIDFIDERFAIYQIGFTLVTRSSYFVEAGLLDKLGGRLLRKIDLMSEWEAACLQFIDQLREVYSSEKIVLHKAFFTYEFIDKKGNIKSFDTRKTNIYKSINKILDHYYHFFEKNMPGIKVIELPKGSYYAWEGHEWGLAPMHYENSYYEGILEKLNKEVLN